MGKATATESSQAKTGSQRLSLARSLAPEEIRRGDYVTPLYTLSEWPSFFWCCDGTLQPRDEVVRISSMPSSETQPLKVRSVCLPFVLVKTPGGEVRTLDVRKARLARLDRRFARAAWRGLKKRAKREARLLAKL